MAIITVEDERGSKAGLSARPCHLNPGAFFGHLADRIVREDDVHARLSATHVVGGEVQPVRDPRLRDLDIGGRLTLGVHLDGSTENLGTNAPSAAMKVVTPGYFELMGIPLVEGRFLNRDDDARGELVVVINQYAAERYWPGESALGQTIAYTEHEEEELIQRRVVGVIGDVRWAGPQRDPTEELYQTHLQTTEVWRWLGQGMSVVAGERRGAPLTLARVQTLVAEVDPNLPVVGFRTLNEVPDSSVAAPRFQGTLLGLFVWLARLLAAVSTYSASWPFLFASRPVKSESVSRWAPTAAQSCGR